MTYNLVFRESLPIVFLLIILGHLSLYGQKKVTDIYNVQKNIATQGYDVVSYFEYDKPVEGSEAFKTEVNGVIFLFDNQKNLDKFKSNPKMYQPQYGGWCAYAMGNHGSKVKIDPETFKIVDGKLYLFYNFYLNNTLNKWNRDEAVLKKKADDNWSEMINH